ncbi:hypothetical protein CAEBREN_21501 [Caenorhabditis brenneri]|uniref:C-type lectin domain-containing protein n=1 Tax=Caenorhabditis brenneri TaxID=135651 RepID=G0MIR9_CAEBE|nr:hypothetical protein CAEBREN_21501 [Caenorhabditis brenneri]
MLFLQSFLWVTVAAGAYFDGFHSSSSSSSEEHTHRHRKRPNYPRKPRPPRPSVPAPTPPPQCPSDWMTSIRPQGTWCIKVFYEPTTSYTAQARCQAQGAVLTGLQDANERMMVANAGRALNNQYNGGNFAQLWIDGKRKPQCPNKPSCAKYDTFQWTDGHTTGIAGFYWPGPEPNAFYVAKWGVQSCIIMHLSRADGQGTGFGYHHGDLDDEYCQQTNKLYACGKIAA